MESRTAKFNGKYAQYLEYYAGAYKTYSMYNVTDKDIYTFHFYPCANTGLTGGVVNEPTVQFGALTDAYVGQAYTLTFTVDAVFGVQELRASLNGTDLACTEAAGVYTCLLYTSYTCSAPRRMAQRAPSMATLPPPTTATALLRMMGVSASSV